MSSTIFHSKDINIHRDSNGIPHVEASTTARAFWGLGYCHALDRGLQALLMRILGRGEGSRYLDPSDSMMEVDLFFRQMNWKGKLDEEVEKLIPPAMEACQAYTEGMNEIFQKKIPWELRMLGYSFEPWRKEDILLLSRMMGYINLAQSQGEIERLFLQMVQSGISIDKLESLFPGLLEGLDEKQIRKIKILHPLLPRDRRWQKMAPPLINSNNWVLSGKKTSSGKTMLCNDPHLEINRLPNVWYEAVLKVEKKYLMGATVPGIPMVLLGRSHSLSWGATYTFLDGIDSWIEQCKEGKYLYEGDWKPFQIRKEVIERKKKNPVEKIFYENHHGTLEGDPHTEGHYLCTRWASSSSGGKSLNQMLSLWNIETVEEAMESFGQIETAWNWVFADIHGNMGYQMSGLMPLRRKGWKGFIPLEGWKKENDWQGFVDAKDLPRCLNPEKGYLVTANQNLNSFGKAHPINICQGPYRADLIGKILEEGEHFTLEEMKKIHLLTFSLQAEAYMKILRPLLPQTLQGRILEEWNGSYEATSQGAFLFEQVYHHLLIEIFGRGGMGEDAVEFLLQERGIFADFFYNFDAILLSENSPWWEGKNRDELYRPIVQKALQCAPQPWGKKNSLILKHILLGETIFGLALNKGPVSIVGGRATPHQGQIYKSGNRLTSFAPSYRMVVDMGEEGLHSNMAGGPSDRRFSKWYVSDLENWKKGRYKKLGIK